MTRKPNLSATEDIATARLVRVCQAARLAQLEEATRKLDHATVVLANIVTILRLPRPEPWQVAQIREVMDRWLPGE